MRIALVLGAGGMPAWGFHLGVAAALEEKLGVSVAEVELVIGTSAGAAIGASLRSGNSRHEVLSAVTTPPTEEERQRVRDLSGTPRQGIGRFLPLSLPLAARGVINPRRAGLIMAGVLPHGFLPTLGLGRLPGIDESGHWPAGLWVPSVRVSDARVVVFGRDGQPAVSTRDAVEASSAVPGMFHPKVIHGHRYVDGATASSTHAGLASETEPDLVIISSVQSRPGWRASRILARRQLPGEVRRLTAGGAKVVVISPTAALADQLAGFPRATEGREHQIVTAVSEHASAALARADGR